ncbi:ATP-binding cassette domain-containing protein [Rickettsiales endosymbiont of Peranema trichophorum]|uniref:ABC transporter ATP-binding protein n=1 Tax=Rickettsiales endosymbiont of Peranema trichophorum TaxID=2486577 RepID=UPI001023E3B6|nr:ATP-binding cassette domain-containing protein [Rickettsiales endosymbiont of Peranema trichophorum]RZI46771.1 ATP-binding cassette domain-containing protein [Rickettsiales endosymbiont of Peranema trichophorum]
MLVLDNIDVTLGKGTKLERPILKELNLKVDTGDFVVVIGSNGSGKSTMLKVISGLIKPDKGRVLINRQDMTCMPQIQRSALVSSVMQDPRVGTIENMTIFENMAFAFKRGQGRGLYPFYSASRRQFFKDKLSVLNMGLEERMDETVGNLSGGQRQALSLIMALLVDSKILLLDEVNAALDPGMSQMIMELMHKVITDQQRTCIMITHNMGHAIAYGNRLVLLKNGNFQREYSAAEKERMTQASLSAHFEEI